MALVIEIKIKNSSGKESTISYSTELSRGAEGVTYKATLDGKPIILKRLTNLINPLYEVQLLNQLRVEAKLVGAIEACRNPSRGIACFKGIIGPARVIDVYKGKLPEIIPLSYTSETPGVFLIYDLLEGKELFEYITKNELSKEQIVSIIKQLLTILSTLHANGILHADIKPENLYYDIATNKVVTIDYGFSCIPDFKCGFSTLRRGTPVYMAPELFRGVTDKNLLPIDIFAAGMTIYTLIVGGLYFSIVYPVEEGKLPPDVGTSIQDPAYYTSETPKYWVVTDAGYTENFYSLFLSMISQDPSKRPTAAEALSAFETLEREGKLFSKSAAGGAGVKAIVAPVATVAKPVVPEGGRRTRRKKNKKNRKSRSRR